MRKKVVLLTGCNGQLGEQLIVSLLSENFKIYGIDIDEPMVKHKSHDFIYKCVDITSESEVGNLVTEINEESGRVDVVINNAAIGTFEHFQLRSKKDFMRVMEVNVFGAFNIIKNTINLFDTKDHPGNIINIGSIYGLVSSDPNIYEDLNRMNSEVYSASKAGVIQLTKYFAVHLAKLGICVNAISPGGIYNQHPEKFLASYSQKTPMGRMASVEEVSSAVMIFCKNNNRYLTGQNLTIDGGFTAW